MRLETNMMTFLADMLLQAIGVEAIGSSRCFAIEDRVDRQFGGHIPNLSTTEGVSASNRVDSRLIEFRNHGVSDGLADAKIRLFKVDFIKETTLEGRIEGAREIGGGNEDAIEILQFL